MAEEIDRGSSDRQATWVALRTLRQRPTVVGQTDDGATVYEIRSVRLVLTPGSSHFKRLVPCARCGREVPGSSVLSILDLDQPANSVFCDRCARSGSPGPEIRRTREDPPAPVENAGELQLPEQVANLLRRQSAELAKMSASVAQVRAEMGELGESNRALAGGQRDLDKRIVELESHPGAEIDSTWVRELADVRASLGAMVDATAMIDTERMELRAALAEGLDLLRAETAGLERRLESLEQKAEEGERHMEALAASADAGASRQHALEQLIESTAQQLARLIESQTQTAPGGRPVPGGIMESLERQLRAAELRLQRTTGDAVGE